MTTEHFQRALIVLLCAALALATIGRHTDIDWRLADAMFDFKSMIFPWRDNWFADDFMHYVVKVILIGIGLVPVVVLMADRVMANSLLDAATRKSLRLVVASFILVPAAISILKSMSMHHCPWSITRYGGFAPYVRIFDSIPDGVSAGKCFPAGHASSGLWIASVAGFWLPHRPGKALTVFCAGLVPGLTLGWVQQMRGAHFLTHTLWSAWIAALIMIVLAWLMYRQPADATSIQQMYVPAKQD